MSRVNFHGYDVTALLGPGVSSTRQFGTWKEACSYMVYMLRNGAVSVKVSLT